MIELILLTATNDPKKLDHTIHSIRKYIHNDPDIDYKWIVCYDQYNTKSMSYRELDEMLIDSGLKYALYKSGKPNQKNYGGDMFNGPLDKFMESSRFNNPWVYILDHDNIIHPLLIWYFKKALNYSESNPIIWTNLLLSCGFVNSPHRLKALVPFINGLTIYFPDPSSLFLRYQFIKSNGLYPSTSTYDVDMGFKVIKPNMNIVTLCSDLGFQDNHFVFSYHNGNRSIDDFERTKTNLDNCDYCDVSIRFGGKVDPICYPIDEDLAKVIFELIKHDYITKGYIK